MGQPEKIDVASFTIENVCVDVVALSRESRSDVRDAAVREALEKRAAIYQRDLERRLLGAAERYAPTAPAVPLARRALRPRHAKRCAKRVRHDLRRMVEEATNAIRRESLTDRAWFYGDPKRYALERYERRRERNRLRGRGVRDVVVNAWFRAAWRAEMIEQRRLGKVIAGALADTFQSFGWPITRGMLGAE
jgi:hypothetical protein